LLERAGARLSGIQGRFTDQDFYAALLRGDSRPFLDLQEELATAFHTEGVKYVVSDAAEGGILAHDVCHLLIGTTTALLQQRSGPRLPHLDFLLEGPPRDCPEKDKLQAIILTLTDDAFERKMTAARSYVELAGEVEAALRRYGPDAFRVECLRPVPAGSTRWGNPTGVPRYERAGEQLVAAGHYPQTIRYREHVLPLWQALSPSAARRKHA
jgi:hypothetical protein